MSVRVVRCDTGREHEIPEAALRWGPDTRQGTCRAQLLRGPWLLPGDVPYVLPFEGAKWAVRVHLPEGDTLEALPPARLGSNVWRGGCPDCSRPLALHGIECPSLLKAASESLLSDLSDFSAELGSLLKAAGDALRAETVEDALPHLHAGLRHFGEQDPQAEDDKPEVLGEALELLANALSWVPRDQVPRLWGRIRDFLEQETSAEIRRAWKGVVRE